MDAVVIMTRIFLKEKIDITSEVFFYNGFS